MQRPHSYEQAKVLALSVDASFNVLSNIKYEGRRDNYRDNKTNNYRNNNYHGNKNNYYNNNNSNNKHNNEKDDIYNKDNHNNSNKFQPKQEKECYKCGKSWAPGHICDPKQNNFKEPRDNRRTDNAQVNTLYSAITNRCQSSLLFKPTFINGVEI
jgi:hypothetical protein